MKIDLHINYKATNKYQNPVSEAIFEFLLLPESHLNQISYGVEIVNSLQKTMYKYTNLFGFEVYRIRTTEPFYEMKVSLFANVITKKDLTYTFKPPTRKISDNLMQEIDFQIDHHVFLKQTKLTNISQTDSNSLISWKADEPIFDFITKLNQTLFDHLEYTKGVTKVNTVAQEVLNLKKGVSQDFTHLFIGICRNNKIPARYVSGYLNEDAGLKGKSMHAWSEVLIPTIGWIGFDPVNNVMIDENYVKVSHGSDYNDCAPIKGVLFTNGENETNFEISVRQTQQ